MKCFRKSKLNCLIGFRSALKREEIEFTLPLFRGETGENAEDDTEENKAPECDTTNDFLESLGIEADSLPGLSNQAKYEQNVFIYE